jgi:hypothetical protein
LEQAAHKETTVDTHATVILLLAEELVTKELLVTQGLMVKSEGVVAVVLLELAVHRKLVTTEYLEVWVGLVILLEDFLGLMAPLVAAVAVVAVALAVLAQI